MATGKKRGQGTRGLCRRGGSWRYDFIIRGQRFTGTIGPVSKTVAQEECDKARVRAREGLLSPKREKPSPVFATEKLLAALSSKLVDDGSFAYKFLTWSESNKRSYLRDRVSVKALGKTFAGCRLNEISPWLIEKYRKLRKEQGRTVGTVNRELSCLRRMFNKAIAWKEASSNPMHDVKLAKEDNGRTRYLEPAEERSLMDALPAQLNILVVTAINTGLRAGELMTLVPESVDCIADVITVPAAYSKNGDTRSVPMNETVKAALKPLAESTPKGERIFRNSRGKPYTRHGYTRAFKTALKRAGIKNFRFHDLRHCFGSFMAMGGVHPTALQQLMGHKDAKMTARYTHLSPTHLRDEVRVLDKRQAVSESRHFSHHGGEARDEGQGAGLAIPARIREVS